MRMYFKQKFFSWFDSYDIYDEQGNTIKEFTFFKPRYDIDYNGWHIDGSFMEWDYTITNANGSVVASISKELLHITDQYVIDVQNQEDALIALMFVLAIDAEKCSRND